MRGSENVTGSLFSYVDLEERIPSRHPLRTNRSVVNDALRSLDAVFDRLYAGEGRPSIAPERLIRASLLQILYSIRSERQLMAQMDYKLLFRWLVGLGIDDTVWVPTVLTKNCDRLLTTDMSRKIMAAILAHREVAPLLSDDHFSVDGTLVKAWAPMKSFQPQEKAMSDGDDDPDDPPDTNAPPRSLSAQSTAEPDPMIRLTRRSCNSEVDFRGERRSAATHASMTDPEARLFKKSPGAGAMLCFMGHRLKVSQKLQLQTIQFRGGRAIRVGFQKLVYPSHDHSRRIEECVHTVERQSRVRSIELAHKAHQPSIILRLLGHSLNHVVARPSLRPCMEQVCGARFGHDRVDSAVGKALDHYLANFIEPVARRKSVARARPVAVEAMTEDFVSQQIG